MGPIHRFSALLFGAAVIAAEEYFEGDGTSYTLGDVSSGNCNFMSAMSTASTNYVALNQDQWDNMGGCGRCIEVSCIDEQCTVQNKTAVVQVLDRCPECAHGALDLSPTVYKEITGMDPNRLKMRWRFVDCPNPGNVQVCLKEGSNAEWVAVQPTNGKVGVKSVMINDAATTMLDGAYYYVLTSNTVDLSATKVSITSIDGEEIVGTYSLDVGSCTDTKQQFGSAESQSPSSNTTPAPQTSPTSTNAPTAAPTSTPAAQTFPTSTNAPTAAPTSTPAAQTSPTSTDAPTAAPTPTPAAQTSPTSTDAPTAEPTPTPDISQTTGSSEVGQESDVETSQAPSQLDHMNSTQETLATLTSDYEPATLNITSQTPETATQTPTLAPEYSTAAPSDATETPTLTPEESTAAPNDATETPTLTPVDSTAAPSGVPDTPEAATETPTLTPDVPTAAPSDAPTQTSNASKCRVKGHK